MSASLSILLFLLLISLCQINATPVPELTSQGRNLIQFANMIRQILDTSPFNYIGYGCWCGFGGKGEPIDATDACCKAHDQCYSDIIHSRANVFSCSPYFSIYNWDLDSKTLLPVCKDESSSCAYQICECDRIATECYKQNVHTFNKSLKCFK